MIQRILKMKKGEEQTYLIKESTKNKYTNINIFQMIKA